jgi:sugar O-acyltransferase (sialic acid O-acetyltransferase NeuD family)
LGKKKTPAGCVILGGGGHARVLIDSLRRSGLAFSYSILDRDPSLWGKSVFGIPVMGGDDLLPRLVEEGAEYFLVGVGSTGDARPRRRLFELGLSYRLEPLTVIHPASVCSPMAEVGAGSQLLPGSVLNAGARLGLNVILNSGAIVEHDCVLQDHVHVATGAVLASTVRVGTGAHVGAGSTVKENIAIGEGAVVGAGAVVVRDVLPHTVVLGIPARFARKVET